MDKPCLSVPAHVTHNGTKTIGDVADHCPPLAGDQGSGNP